MHIVVTETSIEIKNINGLVLSTFYFVETGECNSITFVPCVFNIDRDIVDYKVYPEYLSLISDTGREYAVTYTYKYNKIGFLVYLFYTWELPKPIFIRSCKK